MVQTNGHLGVALELDGQKRVLKSGDPFEDGWFIGALNYQQVELRKGRARRQIGLFVKPNEVLSESKS